MLGDAERCDVEAWRGGVRNAHVENDRLVVCVWYMAGKVGWRCSLIIQASFVAFRLRISQIPDFAFSVFQRVDASQ